MDIQMADFDKLLNVSFLFIQKSKVQKNHEDETEFSHIDVENAARREQAGEKTEEIKWRRGNGGREGWTKTDPSHSPKKKSLFKQKRIIIK